MAFNIENGILTAYIEEKGITEVVIPDSVMSIGDGVICYTERAVDKHPKFW